ncbi:MAG: putative Ig domain-containing protein [bacterium]|nr:putative Ig domain-containing protein [bacterium]
MRYRLLAILAVATVIVVFAAGRVSRPRGAATPAVGDRGGDRPSGTLHVTGATPLLSGSPPPAARAINDPSFPPAAAETPAAPAAARETDAAAPLGEEDTEEQPKEEEAAATDTPEEKTAETPAEEEADETPPLEIATEQLPFGAVGRPYGAELAAEGGEPPYAWKVSSGALPDGIVLDAESGALAGTPASVQSREVGFTVSDEGGDEAESRYVMTVMASSDILVPIAAGIITTPLYLVTGTLPDARVDERYLAQLEAQGGTPPYAWSVSSGTLPEGLSIGGEDGLIRGTPSASGRETFRIRVSDADRNADTAEYSVAVRPRELAIVTAALPGAEAGAAYEAGLEAEGGIGPYRWGIEAGALPDGLSLDAAGGRILGTPRGAGEFEFVARVTDSEGAEDAAALLLAVHSTGLVIVTDRLPQGLIGTPYGAQLDADGGLPPYRWTLSGGRLPEGLVLDAASGTISGTPSGTAEDYAIEVTVTDLETAQDSRDFTLRLEGETAEIAVSGLRATPSDRKAGITWENPRDPAYSHTVLVRALYPNPAHAGDGTAVYTGTDPHFLDTGLENNVTYHYAAFPVTLAGAEGKADAGGRAAVMPREVTPRGPADPFADAVAAFRPLSPGGFGSGSLSRALGPPQGGGIVYGSTDVVSLHARPNTDGGASAPYGGSITLEFTDNIVTDGPGADLVVFENVFYVGGDPHKRWMEPAVVAVSMDGARFYTFPFDFIPHYDDAGGLNLHNPYCYFRGFAGVNPVFSNNLSPDPRAAAAGGDRFDLAEVGLPWIRYVRIISTGDNWLTDMNGDRVRHILDMGAASGGGSSGFDLDAVCAVNH